MAKAGKGTKPELRLLRLVAATTARRDAARAQIDPLAAACDPAVLIEHAVELRLAGLLGLRLPTLAPALAEQLEGALATYRAAAQREGIGHQLVAGSVLDALGASGVLAVPIKGSFWSQWLYGDLATRVSADIDLLVRSEDLDRAVVVLGSAGFEPPFDLRGRDDLPYLHLTLRHPAAREVELHWRLHWIATAWSREALESAVPTPEGPLRLSGEHELIAALVFAARDGFRGLRYLADAATIWDTRREQLPTDGLEGVVARHPELRRTLATAVAHAEGEVGLPFGALLADTRRADASRLALRLADWPLAVPSAQSKGDISLIDGLLTPPRHLGEYVRRSLVPPAASFVLHHPELADAPARVRLKQGEHTARMAGRFLRAFAFPRPR
jgi:Uncharacterised nucleotidyltransferase